MAPASMTSWSIFSPDPEGSTARVHGSTNDTNEMVSGFGRRVLLFLPKASSTVPPT
eukprot:CAMPEP_0167801924 /NCGR_PEP_ID=MMETSP0111_2-20121227/18773_1 /TAXON_ID=91324 /ORGANISM="Lotharella globosa, Strain CCCM811" /LENGTH=55 /DNA_ID=CAMNT_0007697781 /DNA_START=138 /DNA_END=301 /DNA_ORIENTATION=+